MELFGPTFSSRPEIRPFENVVLLEVPRVAHLHILCKPSLFCFWFSTFILGFPRHVGLRRGPCLSLLFFSSFVFPLIQFPLVRIDRAHDAFLAKVIERVADLVLVPALALRFLRTEEVPRFVASLVGHEALRDLRIWNVMV